MHTLLAVALLAAAPDDSPTSPGLEARLATLFKSSGLTADEAARLALATSRDVAAKQAARDAAEAATDSAKLGYVPRLTGSAGYTRLSNITAPTFGLGDEGRFVVTTGPAGPVGNRPLYAAADFGFPVILDNGMLRAGLSIPLSDYLWRTAQQVASASHQRDAAGWDVVAARARAAGDARLSFYQWVRGRGQQLVALQALEQARGRDQDIHHAFEAGSASRADTMRGDSAVESSRLLVARAENAALLAEEALSIALHQPPGAPLEVGEDIFRPLPPVADAADFEALVKEAVAQRVELKALGESLSSVDAQRKSLWANVAPRLDATASAMYANPNPRYQPADGIWHGTWDVGVVVSWAPSDIPLALASVSATDARARQMEAQRQGLLDALRLEVRQAFLALRESEAALSSTTAALAASEESYRVRQDLFRNGRATVVEVIEAETDLTRARLEAINAHIDARVARVRLEHATGRDLAGL